MCWAGAQQRDTPRSHRRKSEMEMAHANAAQHFLNGRQGQTAFEMLQVRSWGNCNECYSSRRKAKTNMSTQSSQINFFKLLEPHIERGSQLLIDKRVFAEAENCLPVTLKNSYTGLSPRGFMEKLTEDLLFQTTDPSGLNDFDGIIKRLPPLGEIKKSYAARTSKI